MGHSKKVKISRLRYAVLNKETNKINLFFLKTHVANYLGVNKKTIYRNINYKNQKFEVYEVKDVNV